MAKNSWHMQGKAADIRVAELGVSALAAAAGALKAFQRGGIGQYPSDGFVHVDVRGVPYRWEGMNPQLDPDWNPMFGLDDRWPLA